VRKVHSSVSGHATLRLPTDTVVWREGCSRDSLYITLLGIIGLRVTIQFNLMCYSPFFSRKRCDNNLGPLGRIGRCYNVFPVNVILSGDTGRECFAISPSFTTASQARQRSTGADRSASQARQRSTGGDAQRICMRPGLMRLEFGRDETDCR
jgi:hypothetical protein